MSVSKQKKLSLNLQKYFIQGAASEALEPFWLTLDWNWPFNKDQGIVRLLLG